MKVFKSHDDFGDLAKADSLHFVGTITPARLVLQQVVATAAMAERARNAGDLVIIDTTAVASGVAGETLKYHKTELCRPEKVVALQFGGMALVMTALALLVTDQTRRAQAVPAG